jgi:putative transposase
VMKKRRFSVEQIVGVFRQSEVGVPVAVVFRKAGTSEQIFYRWKKQYTVLESDQVREMKLLQDENSRLKQLVVELSINKTMLQDARRKMRCCHYGAGYCEARCSILTSAHRLRYCTPLNSTVLFRSASM